MGALQLPFAFRACTHQRYGELGRTPRFKVLETESTQRSPDAEEHVSFQGSF